MQPEHRRSLPHSHYTVVFEHVNEKTSVESLLDYLLMENMRSIHAHVLEKYRTCYSDPQTKFFIELLLPVVESGFMSKTDEEGKSMKPYRKLKMSDTTIGGMLENVQIEEFPVIEVSFSRNYSTDASQFVHSTPMPVSAAGSHRYNGDRIRGGGSGSGGYRGGRGRGRGAGRGGMRGRGRGRGHTWRGGQSIHRGSDFDTQSEHSFEEPVDRSIIEQLNRSIMNE